MFTIRFYRSRDGREWSPIGSICLDESWRVRRTDPPDLDRALVSDAIITLYRERVAFGRAATAGVEYRWAEE